MSKKSPRFLRICMPKRGYLPENQVIWQIFSSMCTGPYEVKKKCVNRRTLSLLSREMFGRDTEITAVAASASCLGRVCKIYEIFQDFFAVCED